MKSILKKWIALLLCVMLCIASSGCVSTYLYAKLFSDLVDADTYTQSVPTTPEATAAPDMTDDAAIITPHEDVSFSGMVYVRPDVDQLENDLNALLKDVASDAFDADTLLARYDEVKTAYDTADSQMSLAYLLYAFDVTTDEYKDEYDFLANELTDLDLLMTELSISLLESDNTKDAAAAAWGEDYVDAVYAGEELNSPDIQALVSEELQLTFDYDAMLTSFTYTENGTEYALDDIVDASDWEMYDRYKDSLNQQAGPLFLKLLKNRDQQAKILGFDNYAVYRYACYERDYDVAETKALQAAVKQYLVPLYYSGLLNNYYDLLELDDLSFSLDEYLPKLQAACKAFSPYVDESLSYMLRNDLYDFTVSDSKMEGSFTTYFADYKAPFIFSQWDGVTSNVSTIIHELGHFTNYYHNAESGWSSGDSLDLAEVDSQGLELLMMPSYESFYGENADTARVNMLLDALYAVISGCMEDEFQQLIYENPTITLAEMNTEYSRLAGEYGLGELYGYTGMEWVMIPHTFQSPMYYISYAVSMIAALELWELSLTDTVAAGSAYITVVMRPAYSTLRDTVQDAGCSDPLSVTTVQKLAAVLKSHLS